MNINDYKEKIKELNFKEYPLVLLPREPQLRSFLEYKDLDIQLKVHLIEMLIVRSFPPSGGVCMPDNVNWFINDFLLEFDYDKIQHWNSNLIRDSIIGILSNDHSKNIQGTLLLYSVIEFYAKYELGFKPSKRNFWKSPQDKFSKMQIHSAFIRLKKSARPIAQSLIRIDKKRAEYIKELYFGDIDELKITIVDKLTFFRNIMMHGESYYPDQGKYLVLLYILFHMNYDL